MTAYPANVRLDSLMVLALTSLEVRSDSYAAVQCPGALPLGLQHAYSEVT